MVEKYIGDYGTGYEDTGCVKAHELLGHKIRCQDCPFEPCLYKDWTWAPEEVRDSEVVFKAWCEEGNVGKVAKKLGMSVGTARSYLRDYMFEGIHFYQACLAPDPEYQDLIKRYIILCFEEGRPLKKLAWACNISYQHACRILRAAGKQLRPGRPHKHA